MDTSLAETYIKEHKHFEVEPREGRCFVFSNGSAIADKDLKTFYILESTIPNNIDCKNYRKFYEKLKDNLELFCQLEYLIRKTDIEDTKNYLKLILKYVDCCYSPFHPKTFSQLVTEDTPLYVLGCGIHCPQTFRLFTTMKTGPLCHLFYEVCLHAGIKTTLAYINDVNVGEFEKLSTLDRTKEPKGCTAVYTDQADIDNGVNVLLKSSLKAPWRIDRILVQESVYEAVVSVLSSKGRRMTADRPRQYVEAFETSCGTVAVTVGDVEPEPGLVRLETYRTVRELLALLAEHSAPFLSLWCSESAQATEMAAGAPASYIWINGYGDFDGPPELALALYTTSWNRFMKPQLYDKITQCSVEWSTLGWEERKSIVLDTIDKFPPDVQREPLMWLVTDFESEQFDVPKVYQAIENWKPQEQVRMESDKITIVVDSLKPKKIYKYNFCKERDIVPALECVMRGYPVGVCYYNLHGSKCKKIITAMNEVGIPIMPLNSYDITDEDSGKEFLYKLHPGNKKVIQTTYRTI